MPQSAPALPPTPPAPGAPYVVRMNQNVVSVYEAALAQREVLGQQLDRLNGERENLTGQLEHGGAGADRVGVEARIAATDARIAALDKQIAQADAKVAETAAIPGAVSGHRAEERWANQHDNGTPEAFIAIPIVFFITVLFPLSVAYARRVWRRGGAGVAALPSELMERMARLDQAVDSIAIEVERIGEGQRFMTRVLTDGSAKQGVGVHAARENADR